MRLVVCSNSSPRWEDGVGLLPRSPGGLVPLLVTLLAEHGGDWLCTVPLGGSPVGPSDPDSEDGVEVVALPGDVALHQVRRSKAVLEQHYEDIGIRLMLWLFHYLFDTAREPVFDGAFAQAWAGYESVNRAYADHLATVLRNSPDELVLINDYHLFLVPEMLEPRAHRASTVAYFHGLPWCEPEYFDILPARIRDRILASLLRCDIVGFHCTRWARAFLACCARFLPDCATDDEGVVLDGHRTRISVASFPLDVPILERMRDAPETVRWRQRLRAAGGGRRVIVRADRIDLWKNLPRGFAAYRSLLQRRPELAGDWWFCAVVTVPSRTTERSRDLRRVCEEMVEELNERFGTPGRPAVSLIWPDLATTRNCVVAALSDADLVLVNPTIDGMNLVAKEALYFAEHGSLLLSPNAGAYEGLADHVTPVDPFDVEATAAAMLDAMDSGQVPARQVAGRELLRGHDATTWLAELTGSAVPGLVGR
ncbi:MAG TPA: trehalose-6-phosphate synthase [Pseudonocardiaceae bacterium]|jgi:trehalose 6-phosphate synthase|nr:trehalose-6-phosphate synthase [Pseudonocardiaceae bacterium]